mgnify:CR=1 FL=1
MPPVIALLGPTNTGKTYHAMERMLEHGTGMIGFPLRLRQLTVSVEAPSELIEALTAG